MTTPVTFEIAKLLKEKGFDLPQLYFYIGGEISWKVDNTRCRNKIEGEYSAPTIAEVVMWLYEKYKLFITLYPYDEFRNDLFSFFIIKRGSNKRDKYPYKSPTEAYLEAIEYALKNLI